jgi:NAD(P)H-dependent FMN reductase
MNEYNRGVLERLRPTLELYSDGLATSVEDLQHRLPTAGELLERDADELTRALHEADADCELLLFATPVDQQPQQLRHSAQVLRAQVDAALSR